MTGFSVRKKILLMLLLRRRRHRRIHDQSEKKRKIRRWWIRNIFKKRKELGEYHRLFQELKLLTESTFQVIILLS